MQLSTSFTTSPFQSQFYLLNNLTANSFLPRSLFLYEPCKTLQRFLFFSNKSSQKTKTRKPSTETLTINASLLETPVLWAGRLCIYYALLKGGLAGSQANPLVSGWILFLTFCAFIFCFKGLIFIDFLHWVFAFCVLGLESGGVTEAGDLGFSKWLENIQGKPGLWVSLFFCIYFLHVMKL